MVLSNFFTTAVLPFLLVFVLVFAILQKSKILGEGKAQIDSLVSLAIALILISVPQARDIVVNLMPWIAVGISVLLTFFILYGFVAGDFAKQGAPKWMKITFGILIGVFTIVVVLGVTGLGDWFSGLGEGFWTNTIMVVVVIVAFIIAVVSGKRRSSSG